MIAVMFKFKSKLILTRRLFFLILSLVGVRCRERNGYSPDKIFIKNSSILSFQYIFPLFPQNIARQTRVLSQNTCSAFPSAFVNLVFIALKTWCLYILSRSIRQRHSSSAILQTGTQLHAWWHIFTGYATYLHIVFSSYARSLHLKKTCRIKVLNMLLWNQVLCCC